jgi:hypothetical protein
MPAVKEGQETGLAVTAHGDQLAVDNAGCASDQIAMGSDMG